jgi:hypothetical protein
MFLHGANEIAKIDVAERRSLCIGRIGVALDAIHAALGKSERDFERTDERVYSLLSEAFTDVYAIRIRGRAHLFNEFKRHVPQEREIYASKAEVRDRVERLMRRLAKKLVNGHSGVWI